MHDRELMTSKTKLQINSIFLFLSACFFSLDNKLAAKQNPQEHPIAVVVTSYNNARWYRRNLDSIFSQKYHNYRLIYVDDASTDNTPNLVEEYFKEHKLEHKCTLVRNEEWQSQLANHYRAAHLCNDDEILLNIDGDDYFSEDTVFATINDAYKTPGIWMTYGLMSFEPHVPPGPWEKPFVAIPDAVIKAHSYRQDHWDPAVPYVWDWFHPRSFYACIFKKIKLEDLLYEGSFKPLSPSADSCFMYPILEMVSHHSKFIDKILYRWNWQNPLSQQNQGNGKDENRGAQWNINQLVRTWEKYQPLAQLPVGISKQFDHARADVILLSHNNPQALSKCLKAVQKNVRGVGKIHVLYECSKNSVAKRYAGMRKDFSKVNFTRNHSANRDALKNSLRKILKAARKHVVLSTDSYINTHALNLNECIKQLEKTFALGFYLHLSQPASTVLDKNAAFLGNDTMAWQLHHGKHIWPQPNKLGSILYKTNYVLETLNKLNFASIGQFTQAWASTIYSPKKVGLFFKNPILRKT